MIKIRIKAIVSESSISLKFFATFIIGGQLRFTIYFILFILFFYFY